MFYDSWEVITYWVCLDYYMFDDLYFEYVSACCLAVVSKRFCLAPRFLNIQLFYLSWWEFVTVSFVVFQWASLFSSEFFDPAAIMTQERLWLSNASDEATEKLGT